MGTATISSVWETIAFSQIAPKDAAGHPILSKAFSNAADLTLLGHAVADACDAADGVKDGLIFNTKACHFDPEVIACEGPKTSARLSTQQVSVLKKVFGGPKNSAAGHCIELALRHRHCSSRLARAETKHSETAAPNSADVLLMFSGLKGFFFTPPDPNFDPMKFNFDTDTAQLDNTNVFQDSLLTFLSTFSKRGGKLMLIHGMSDPFFSAYDTAAYYERVVRDNGGLEKTMPWVRYFEVPGMNHCGGGPALEDFDPLTALVEWTEKKAPTYGGQGQIVSRPEPTSVRVSNLSALSRYRLPRRSGKFRLPIGVCGACIRKLFGLPFPWL